MVVTELLKAKPINVANLRKGLSKILDNPKPYLVNSTGDRRMFLLPYEDVIEMVEIIEESRDAVLRREITEARASYQATGGVPVEE